MKITISHIVNTRGFGGTFFQFVPPLLPSSRALVRKSNSWRQISEIIFFFKQQIILIHWLSAIRGASTSGWDVAIPETRRPSTSWAWWHPNMLADRAKRSGQGETAGSKWVKLTDFRPVESNRILCSSCPYCTVRAGQAGVSENKFDVCRPKTNQYILCVSHSTVRTHFFMSSKEPLCSCHSFVGKFPSCSFINRLAFNRLNSQDYPHVQANVRSRIFATVQVELPITRLFNLS